MLSNDGATLAVPVRRKDQAAGEGAKVIYLTTGRSYQAGVANPATNQKLILVCGPLKDMVRVIQTEIDKGRSAVKFSQWW